MPEGVAIIVGINDFPNRLDWGLPEIKKPEESARWMADFARNRLKYRVPEPLLGKAARIDVWKDAVEKAASGLKDEDVLLLSFSGHGSRIPSEDVCSDRNGSDEAWCFFDGYLLDNGIRAVLADLPSTIRVFVVADCCYAAGTHMRFTVGAREEIVLLDPATGRRLRKTARALRKRVAEAWHRQHGEGIAAECEDPTARILLLASCGEEEEGEDGLFMGALRDTLMAAPDSTFDQLIKLLRERISQSSSKQVPRIVPIGRKKPSLRKQTAFAI